MKQKVKTLKITLEVHIEGEEGVNLQAQVYRLLGKLARLIDRHRVVVPTNDVREMFVIQLSDSAKEEVN